MTALVAAAMAGVGVTAVAPTAGASVATFPVMNTSEQPPDRVWFRNSAHQNDTNRETGFGIYSGQSLAVDCFSWGDAVGPYNNHIWYKGLNASQPTVNGHANYGWMNTHYVNDGMTADHADPRIPDCNAAPPAPARTAVAGYYSPFNKGGRGDDGRVEDLADQAGTNTAYVSDWYACAQTSTKPYFALQGLLDSNQYYDRVGGWSLGRLGPVYLIRGMRQYDPNLLRDLNYVALIDPGPYSDLSVCDVRNDSGNQYAYWLKYNTRARLVILSGTKTQANKSKGIQEVYFNPIRGQAGGTDIRSRVLVCNYSLDHYKIYRAGQYWIKHIVGASTSSCPWLSLDGKTYKPTAGWHP